MTKVSDNRELVARVEEMLDKEHDALLRGALLEIEELLPEKESLSNELLAAGPAVQKELSSLRTSALRNQELLNEALKGIQNVADRIAAMKKVKQQLDTYDAHGQRQTIEKTKQSIERRA
ncbi:flagellar biosynthesis protein FlgN [Primorskyibacter sp. S187A]|uniref:flagellar biosynthesis protein FlgN n=1 Tax=Primorskyibacter sp. S187A TaxID=3415130 RepID=UPI003C7B4CEA